MSLNIFNFGVALGSAVEMMGELARPLGKGVCPLPEPAFRLQACPGAMMLDDCCSEWNIRAPACSSLVTLFSLLPHPWHMFSN